MDVRAFFAAKALEQQQRHLKYQDAIYNLEPNVKESPGGLRDLSSVLWIARAAGLGRSWRELARNGLMTMAEARALSRQERFIGAMRVRLHYLLGRREDRLVFDAQNALARQLGLVDTKAKRASEQLMQRYYRAAKLVRQVNIILLQNLHARLYPAATLPVPIDDEFQQVDELLDMRDEELFVQRPAAMLDAFLMLQKHRELRGMTARTLRRAVARPAAHRRRVPPRPRQPRALHRDVPRRARPAARAAADEPVRHPRPVPAGVRTHRRPDAARPLPRVHGGRAHPDGDPQPAPLHRGAARARVSAVLAADRRLRAARRAVLAGLFHDIAKGRGGDHSALGARDARRFCREHGLSDEDAELVAWLVADHLVMSSTAQKQDLTDPDVIAAFAAKMGSERRLAALYLLTVADIRGTSPKVWNNWKGKLLEDLYHAARAVLAGTAPTRTIMDSIEARRSEAQRLLRLYAVPDGAEAEAVEAPRHALLPAPQRRGDRVARAPSLLARRAARARS